MSKQQEKRKPDLMDACDLPSSKRSCVKNLQALSSSPSLMSPASDNIFPVEFSRDVTATHEAFKQLVFSRKLLSALDSQSNLSLDKKVDAYVQAFMTDNCDNLIDLHMQEIETGDTLFMRIIDLHYAAYEADADLNEDRVYGVHDKLLSLMCTSHFREHVNRVNKLGQTALNFIACSILGQELTSVAFRLLKELLSAGSYVDHVDPSSQGRTALLQYAAAYDASSQTRAISHLELLECGACIDAQDAIGDSQNNTDIYIYTYTSAR